MKQSQQYHITQAILEKQQQKCVSSSHQTKFWTLHQELSYIGG